MALVAVGGCGGCGGLLPTRSPTLAVQQPTLHETGPERGWITTLVAVEPTLVPGEAVSASPDGVGVLCSFGRAQQACGGHPNLQETPTRRQRS